MKQEDKDLLIKDLCARLPYGVKCKIFRVDDKGCGWKDVKLEGINKPKRCVEFDFGDNGVIIDFCDIKPYLFPLSSMTEEQWREITDIQIQESLKSLDSIDDSISNPLFSTDELKTIEWCYANHIDIHDLIPMGLALDATGLNVY